MQKLLSKDKIPTALTPFNFGENINMGKVMQIFLDVDNDYRNFSMFNQSSKILLLPYTLIFFVNGTVILKPFQDLFNILKTHVLQLYSGTTEEHSPRVLFNNRFLVIDVCPNNTIRYKNKLYSVTKETLIINGTKLDELDYFQEIEISIKGYDFVSFSKPVTL